MVWVKPVPACEQAHLRWFTLNRNDFFQLQVSDSDEKGIKQSYRILFTEKGGDSLNLCIELSDILSSDGAVPLIVAQENTEPAVCEDWLYLEKTILPQLAELRGRDEQSLGHFANNQFAVTLPPSSWLGFFESSRQQRNKETYTTMHHTDVGDERGERQGPKGHRPLPKKEQR